MKTTLLFGKIKLLILRIGKRRCATQPFTLTSLLRNRFVKCALFPLMALVVFTDHHYPNDSVICAQN